MKVLTLLAALLLAGCSSAPPPDPYEFTCTEREDGSLCCWMDGTWQCPEDSP